MTVSKWITYVLAAVMVFLFGGIGILLAGKELYPSNSVDTYQTCVLAGGAILETYPDRCVSPDGSGTYSNPKQSINIPVEGS